MRPVLAACMALSLVAGPGAGDGCQDPLSPSLSRSVPAPQLSAEELHSPHMPESLRCDACYAIAFQVGTGDGGHPETTLGQPCLAPHPALSAAAEGGKRGRNVGAGGHRGGCHHRPLSAPFLPQLEEQLSKAEAKLGRKALRESDYVEVLERSCSQSWEL